MRNLSNNNRLKSTRLARVRRSGFAGDLLPGPAMVMFSVGFPTGVQSLMLFRPSEPASLFPDWAGQTATGRLHCSISIFQRVAQATPRRNRRRVMLSPPRMRLAENTNGPARKQGHRSCGRLWKAVRQSVISGQGSGIGREGDRLSNSRVGRAVAAIDKNVPKAGMFLKSAFCSDRDAVHTEAMEPAQALH